MSHPHAPTRESSRKQYWILGVGLVLAITMIGMAIGCQPQHHSASSAASGPSSLEPSAPETSSKPQVKHRKPAPQHTSQGSATGEADGAVPDGVTVFDDNVPGVANLDPSLLQALRQAARNAQQAGITFYVNSGWRSAAYQNRLLREAVTRYGSEREAARWVATAATSLHVKGKAVDIGHTDAAQWLSNNGSRYGLCQIYRNEPWHFELRSAAVDGACPQMYADPTQDPRMRP